LNRNIGLVVEDFIKPFVLQAEPLESNPTCRRNLHPVGMRVGSEICAAEGLMVILSKIWYVFFGNKADRARTSSQELGACM
jgi:hypothetical protein